MGWHLSFYLSFPPAGSQPLHRGIASSSEAKVLAKLTPVGFEPTQLALVELESTPLDHSGKVSC